jgi:biopolymer transport protein TolR
MIRARRLRRDMPRAEINITNLVDVTMTLLVVFMIVAPMLKQGLEIELPKARVAENFQSDDQVILVECDKDGMIMVNQKESMVGEVEQKIREIIEKVGDVPVQVRADKDLPFGIIVGVWGEIRAAGVKSINVELVKIAI